MLSHCVTNAKLMIFHPDHKCIWGKNLQDIRPQLATVSQVGDSGNLQQVKTSIHAPNRPLVVSPYVTGSNLSPVVAILQATVKKELGEVG